MKGIQWVTPLGFPVIQPYRKWGKCTIRTAMQRITLAYRMDEVEVHLARQIQGITANWTHSQDASHCLMTGTEARRRGLAFGSVHDSFWSLAEEIDELNEISRDQFVRLYSGDPISALAAYWREHWPGVDLPDPPARGQLNIDDVRGSTYFFS
jgi:DNA-directed RNA polymerase